MRKVCPISSATCKERKGIEGYLKVEKETHQPMAIYGPDSNPISIRHSLKHALYTHLRKYNYYLIIIVKL